STGLVKGLAEGSATVTATSGKQTDTVQITVQSNLEM
ncbi:Ig-like domain-containing protein, partial [Staphylococcus aureus]